VAQNQVSIVVSGRSYTISADAERDTLLAAVERVNESIARYRKMPMSDELRAATLSAVIFAYDLIEHEMRTVEVTKQLETVLTENVRVQTDLNELFEKQNDILGENGRLRDRFDSIETERDDLLALKNSLASELQKLRDDTELLEIQHESVLETVTVERDLIQAECAEMAREKADLVTKFADSERDFLTKIQSLQDDLELNDMSFSEEREKLQNAFERERLEDQKASEAMLIAQNESHAVAIQVLAESRDRFESECDELRELVSSLESDNETILEREASITREKGELELRNQELEHFLGSLQEERELLQSERDELLDSLTAAVAERDRLRIAVDRVQRDRDETAQFSEVIAAELESKVALLVEEKKVAEAALLKIVGSISSMEIKLS